MTDEQYAAYHGEARDTESGMEAWHKVMEQEAFDREEGELVDAEVNSGLEEAIRCWTNLVGEISQDPVQ